MSAGYVLYLQWEAMLISYLASRNIILPFVDVESLLKDSDYQIAVWKYILSLIYSFVYMYRGFLFNIMMVSKNIFMQCNSFIYGSLRSRLFKVLVFNSMSRNGFIHLFGIIKWFDFIQKWDFYNIFITIKAHKIPTFFDIWLKFGEVNSPKY